MSMARPIHKQRGAIMIMTAIFIIILLGIAALALDLGRLYVLKTEMQNAADAAALAGAAELNGKPGARANARHAAKNALSHQGRFANEPELLAILDDVQAFAFYSWIGSRVDGPKPDDCVVAPDGSGKCLATGDDDAYYIQVRLDPEQVDDGHYQISLYFLPVLGLIVDDVATTAETSAVAVAGTGSRPLVCNIMPLMICNPAEGGAPLVPGQMVYLKEQGGGGAWQPGNFGFLQPTPLTGQLNHDMAFAMASDGPDCSDPYVSTMTGVNAAFPRHGLNTRFGIYNSPPFGPASKATYPPAPNVIDYPRDDNLTPPPASKTGNPNARTCGFDPAVRFGNNNLAGAGLQHTEDTECSASFSRMDYATNFHSGLTVPDLRTRYETYQWELGFDPSMTKWDWMLETPPSTTRIPSLTGSVYDSDCFTPSTNPAQQPCRIHDGDPETTQMDTSAPVGLPKRRIIYVTMLNCQALGITGNTPNIYIGPGTGEFAKFLLTEHVSSPQAGVDIYAEFIGIVDENDELDYLLRYQIQLYE